MSDPDADQTGQAAADIRAQPENPPAGGGPGATWITWTTGDGTDARVTVSVSGSEERLFARGPSGTRVAPWIWGGQVYEFRLRTVQSNAVLATVAVERAGAVGSPRFPKPLRPELRLPTFLLIGTSKAGTTSVVAYLRQHPGVFIPNPKEPHFFSFLGDVPDSRETSQLAPAARRLETIEDYVGLFAEADGAIAIGEASTGYLSNPRAALNVHRYMPAARLIAVLRDPSERAFSFYQMERRIGNEPEADFIEYLRREPATGAIRGGFYARALAAWQNLFLSDQLQVHLTEDLAENPSGTVATMLSHIGVDSTVPIDTSKRHNVGDDSQTMSTEARALLVATYRDDIELLEDMLERDLSAWLQVGQPRTDPDESTSG